LTHEAKAGDEEPALVFLHGAGSNSDFWHEQQSTSTFPAALFPDLPGHTASRDHADAGRPLRSIDEYADWVERYVVRHGRHAVILNGHSMGGAIALTLALRRPSWLKALVLTGAGARLRVLPRLLDLLRTDYHAAVDLIVEMSFCPSDGPLTYAQRVRRDGTRRQMLRTPQEVTLADYEACDRFDVIDRLSEITVPTLCIVGAQDAMTPPKYTESLHAAIRGSRSVVIEGAGHMLPIEQPRLYGDTLLGFISQASER
jgi:pimeloyl-ACP methyl ester carboxylesterase